MTRFIPLFFFYCFATAALGQACPQHSQDDLSKPAESQTLRGRLVFHDGVRKWFELKLDKPTCSQRSIQLITESGNWRSLQVLRGCEVSSTGPVDESPTGYYSLDLYQDVSKIEVVGSCHKQEPFPEEPPVAPAADIRQYLVEMLVDYEPGDHPIVFRITSKGKEIKPRQAYASYFFTGGFVLYGNCGKGFVVDKVFGTPEANPGHFTERRDGSDQAVFDPESAANAGKKKMSLKYTCVRNP